MRYTILFFTLIFLVGFNIDCSIAGQKLDEEPLRLFIDPVKAALVETPTAALPVWRQFQKSKPVLVILSNNPFLQTIPSELENKAEQLVLNGSRTDIEKKAVFHSSNPILMPDMALSAALKSGLFSKVVWVLPLTPAQEMAQASTIRAQLLGNGDISLQESETLKSDDQQIAARFRDTPWTICRIDSLPDITDPIIFHIDLSFFKALYQNEIKTPLYSILASVGNTIKSKNWRLLSATVSCSNLSGTISLRTRFFGADIIRLLESPRLLSGDMPNLWRKRSQALYLDNLFQQERIRDTYLELDKTYPDNASIKYALFDILGQLKQGKKALEYLEDAVALDRIYALEYLNLAERAQNSGQYSSAYSMLEKAEKTFPEDPFITLKKIGMHREMGTIGHAKEMIESLLERTWSEVYDPGMVKFLETLRAEAEKDAGRQ